MLKAAASLRVRGALNARRVLVVVVVVVSVGFEGEEVAFVRRRVGEGGDGVRLW